MVTILFFFVILFFLPANSIYVAVYHNITSTPTNTPNIYTVRFNTTVTRYSKGGEIIYILANIERDPSIISIASSSSKEYDFIEDLHPSSHEHWKPTEQVFSERMRVNSSASTQVHFDIPIPSIHRVWVKVEGGGRGEDAAIMIARSDGEIKLVNQNTYLEMHSTTEMNPDNIYSLFATAEARDGQINVATSFDIFSLDINLGDTVGAVKAKIQEKKGIKSEYQQLIFLGHIMEDENTLEYYGVRTGEKSKQTTLRLSDRVIMVSTNIRIRILATATETVEQLKERVKETLHIPAEEISLQVDRPNQKITLENGHTLAYYNFTDNEVPYVTIKPVDGLLLSVEHLMGNTYVHLPTTATVKELKAQIESKTGIPAAHQNIKLNQMPNRNRMNNEKPPVIEDSKTLSDLKNSITSYLVFPARYKITVYGLEKPIIFNVAESDTVEYLKTRINSLINVPLDQMAFFYAFQELQNDKTLAHYSIFDDSAILVVRNGTFVY